MRRRWLWWVRVILLVLVVFLSGSLWQGLKRANAAERNSARYVNACAEELRRVTDVAGAPNFTRPPLFMGFEYRLWPLGTLDVHLLAEWAGDPDALAFECDLRERSGQIKVKRVQFLTPVQN